MELPQNLSRSDFLKLSGVVGGTFLSALCVGQFLPSELPRREIPNLGPGTYSLLSSSGYFAINGKKGCAKIKLGNSDMMELIRPQENSRNGVVIDAIYGGTFSHIRQLFESGQIPSSARKIKIGIGRNNIQLATFRDLDWIFWHTPSNIDIAWDIPFRIPGDPADDSSRKIYRYALNFWAAMSGRTILMTEADDRIFKNGGFDPTVFQKDGIHLKSDYNQAYIEPFLD